MARRGLLASTLLASTLAGAPLPAQNVLANPGFRTDVAGWVNAGPAIISVVRSSLDVAGDPGSGSAEIPGFRFRVTIETGSGAFPGVMEPHCLAETLCVSGALPGRVEAQLRVIGPRPNGFLWLQVVRFTPSRLVVEAEQLATGKVRHYVLESIGPADRPVSLEDRTAFLP
ncbi:MAG TPA: hypothetical protein VM599_07390 [Thermoanaerobaculia bacterium]|nr:hypothetical protein [Thermoanaerobaculia bacterium]